MAQFMDDKHDRLPNFNIMIFQFVPKLREYLFKVLGMGTGSFRPSSCSYCSSGVEWHGVAGLGIV